jgi:preprotein translocase subunit SecD
VGDSRDLVGAGSTDRSISIAASPGTAPDSGSVPADREDAIDYYRAEYEEMKSCLLLLAPKVPGASTAREVTSGLLAGMEKITVHCQKVETELRKKSTQFQVLKRQHGEAREQVEALERKVAHLSVLEKKIDNKDRQLDKYKKESAAQAAELASRRTMLELAVRDKGSEVEQLRAELAAAQLELAEGRELMLQLIRDSDASSPLRMASSISTKSLSSPS